MNNHAHPKQRNAKRLRLNLLRFGLPSLCIAAVAAALLVYALTPAAAPASAGQNDAAETVLANFTDDLGAASSLEFTAVELSRGDLSAGTLVLVDGSAAWPFPKTETLVNVYEAGSGGYPLSSTGLLLRQEALGPFEDMMTDFQRVTGCQQVMLSECYRSLEDQTALYERAEAQSGAERAAQLVAQPGHSEYHTGYALSLSLYTSDGVVMDFTGTDDSAWLLRNCGRYGFVVRYPEGKSDLTGYAYQPYHLRYVGKPHAYLMGLKGYCLEEYLEYVSHYTFAGNHIQVTDNENQTYEIYYVPADEDTTTVPVPLAKEYTISGDNVSGFIVTVAL